MAFAKLPIPGGPLIWQAASTLDWLAFRDGETVCWLFFHQNSGTPTAAGITVDWYADQTPTFEGWMVVKAVVDQEVTEIGA